MKHRLKLFLMMCLFPSLTFFSAASSALNHTLCEQLLMQYGRMNAPRLPTNLHFHAWTPGNPVTQSQKSLGTLEFYWSQPGAIVVESIAGMNEGLLLKSPRALGRILALTTFAGFVSEEEFREVLEAQPIPQPVKHMLRAPGLVHLVKRLPERYLLLHADTSPQHLQQSLSRKALRKLQRTVESLESMLRRQNLTIESPKLAVVEDGGALLLNFEAVRELGEDELELYLWREKNIVEEALRH